MMRKKVGLALSGGGARGFAHEGVLRGLVEFGIPIDLIAGTSAGAFAGGSFASGMTPDEISKMSTALRWRHVTRPSLSPLGVLSNAPMQRFLERHLPERRIKNCPIRFAAVACDLVSGDQVVIDSGDLAFAIRASCAVPGIFAPVKRSDGRLLVDGDVVSPLPAATARAMGADVVIAVDLMASGATFRSRPRTAAGIAIQSAMTLLRTASCSQHQAADVVIVPEIAHIRPDRLGKRDELIRLGEAAARLEIDTIKSLISTT